MDKKIIISMATMPTRKNRLVENLPSILGQSHDFDIFLINVNNNVTDEDMEWYERFAKQDARIKINRGDDKWRSCNKLLPALKMYPDDIIITIDDDIYYPVDCFKELIEQYEITPDCVIANEANPLKLDDNVITYYNLTTVKLLQKGWDKYLSGCALFPPKIFEGSDLFDYDKMLACTDGLNDELWFWINSTINNVRVVCLNYVRTFASEIKSEWSENEYRLCNINTKKDAIDDYGKRIKEMYGERILHNITNNKTEFILTHKNVCHFCYAFKMIKAIYHYGFIVNIERLTTDWRKTVKSVMNGSKFML